MYNLDLFADGNDFSWETIQKGRNIYYQKQMSNQINDQIIKIISFLTSSSNIHLNLGQTSSTNTSQIFMSLEKMLFQSLKNNQIFVSAKLNSTVNDNDTTLVRVSFISFRGFVIFNVLVNHFSTCFIWKFQISIKYKSFKINFTFNS
jgi:hypothetical protein